MNWYRGMSAEMVRRITVEHEAAHLAGAIHVRALIWSVEILLTTTKKDYLGCVGAASGIDWADGVIELSGGVWTNFFGSLPLSEWVAGDVHGARDRARSGGFQFDDLQSYVMEFLGHQRPNVLRLAARIEQDMPKRGPLKGRKLSKLVRDFQAVIPCWDAKKLRALGNRPYGTPMKSVTYDFYN